MAYDLDEMFRKHEGLAEKKEVTIDSLRIPPDDFLTSGQYEQYRQYQSMKKSLEKALEKENVELPPGFEKKFIATNPAFYQTYTLLGDY